MDLARPVHWPIFVYKRSQCVGPGWAVWGFISIYEEGWGPLLGYVCREDHAHYHAQRCDA